jgi:hypothetical protein
MDIDWTALGLVLLIALVAGSALVSLVALGITALDHRTIAHETDRDTATSTALMTACFLGAATLIGYGLYLVITST